MKKVFLIILSLVFIGNLCVAQGKSMKKSKLETNPTATEQAPAPAKMKKDGTPDMRHKENRKVGTEPTVKTKKDGTPDKRYKASKEAASGTNKK